MGSESRVQEEFLAEQAIMRRCIEAELRMDLMIERDLAIMRSGVEFSMFDRSMTTSLRLKEHEILAFMRGSSGDGVYGTSTVTKPLSDEDHLPPMVNYSISISFIFSSVLRLFMQVLVLCFFFSFS